MISGFFFSSSLKLKSLEFLKRKGMQLLLPIFVWAMIFSGLVLVYHIIQYNSTDYIQILKKNTSLQIFWFLRELFVSYFLVYFSMRIVKKYWLACMLTLCFVLVAPVGNIQLFLLPMFWIGIFLKNNYPLIEKYSKLILIVSFLVFVVCLCFWNGSYTTYFSPFQLVYYSPLEFSTTNLAIACFRWLVAIAGSIFWFVLFMIIHKANKLLSILSQIGIYTMGIYILQTYILEMLINRYIDFSNTNIWLYNFAITPLAASLVGVICIVITKWINKNKWLGLFLIGTLPSKSKSY
jgi:fucose 4-O-acetylase-like acetyltransferase